MWLTTSTHRASISREEHGEHSQNATGGHLYAVEALIASGAEVTALIIHLFTLTKWMTLRSTTVVNATAIAPMRQAISRMACGAGMTSKNQLCNG